MKASLEHSAVALRQVVLHIEAVHTTIRNHFAKEERFLLPLLLKHFDYVEQAELVASFLCSIPLHSVQHIMQWVKKTAPKVSAGLALVQVGSIWRRGVGISVDGKVEVVGVW